MIVKLSIKVVTDSSTKGCFIVQDTEITMDGNRHLIDEIVKKINEIPGVEVR